MTGLATGGVAPVNLQLDVFLRALLAGQYDKALALIESVKPSTAVEREQLLEMAAVVRAMAERNADVLANVADVVEAPQSPTAAFVKLILGAHAGVPVDVALDELAAFQPEAAAIVAAELPPKLITGPRFHLPPGAFQPGEIHLPPGALDPGPIQIGPAVNLPQLSPGAAAANVATAAGIGAIDGVQPPAAGSRQ